MKNANFNYIKIFDDTLENNEFKKPISDKKNLDDNNNLEFKNSDDNKINDNNYYDYSLDNDNSDESNEIVIYDTSTFRMYKYLKLRIDSIYSVKAVSIIHVDSIQGKICVVYRNSKYDGLVYGYWVALKNNNEWKHYYLGLTDNYYYNFKDIQKYPLFINDSIIQIQASIIDKIQPTIVYPINYNGRITYLKENIILQINLNKVIQDSDNDSLTDIVENKMTLNPYSSDTDSDGISDNLDNNPKYASNCDSEISKLYAYLITNIENIPHKRFYSGNSNIAQINSENDNETYMLVTDDPNLQKLNFSKKVIILTPNEYLSYKYPNGFNDIGISQLFKVDNKKNYFILSISQNSSCAEYLIRKVGNSKWKIKTIYFSIS